MYVGVWYVGMWCYVGVRGGCVNGEGIGIENMFHY